jgi:hypothetical protein
LDQQYRTNAARDLEELVAKQSATKEKKKKRKRKAKKISEKERDTAA